MGKGRLGLSEGATFNGIGKKNELAYETLDFYAAGQSGTDRGRTIGEIKQGEGEGAKRPSTEGWW